MGSRDGDLYAEIVLLSRWVLGQFALARADAPAARSPHSQRHFGVGWIIHLVPLHLSTSAV